MDLATTSRATQVGAASLLAVLALLVARGPLASDASRGDPASAASAAQCGAPDVVSLDEAMARAMDRIRLEQGEEDDSGYVVLNNRGFNYGGGPDVGFDAYLVQREAAIGAAPR